MIECYHTEVRKGKNILRKKKTGYREIQKLNQGFYFFFKGEKYALTITSVIKRFMTRIQINMLIQR